MDFKEAEEKYAKLKKEYEEGLITTDYFKTEVRNLITKDRNGEIWSIGMKTGKWYKKVEDRWERAEPPFKTQRIELGDLIPKDEEDKTICPKCGKEVPSFYVFCPYCGARLREGEEREMAERDYILKKISPFSLALFLGGLGIIIGVIVGAFAEAIAPKLLINLGLDFPSIGTLWKSFIYSIGTGFFSFFLFFLIGVISALIFNLVLSVFGGVKFYLT